MVRLASAVSVRCAFGRELTSFSAPQLFDGRGRAGQLLCARRVSGVHVRVRRGGVSCDKHNGAAHHDRDYERGARHFDGRRQSGAGRNATNNFGDKHFATDGN